MVTINNIVWDELTAEQQKILTTSKTWSERRGTSPKFFPEFGGMLFDDDGEMRAYIEAHPEAYAYVVVPSSLMRWNAYVIWDCLWETGETATADLLTEMKRVYWVSRHELSAGQQRALRDLHGTDVEMKKDPVQFGDYMGLADYIRGHPDGFVYTVAGAPHYLHAALEGERFGVFENHPQKRQDGSFGLRAVYHVNGRELRKVWENTDPLGDQGEALMPVKREGVE